MIFKWISIQSLKVNTQILDNEEDKRPEPVREGTNYSIIGLQQSAGA